MQGATKRGVLLLPVEIRVNWHYLILFYFGSQVTAMPITVRILLELSIDFR